MSRPRLLSFLIFILPAAFACHSFSASRESIYVRQQQLFKANRELFNQAAAKASTTSHTNATLDVEDSTLHLTRELISGLHRLGIRTIEVWDGYDGGSCYAKELRFIPDSLWEVDRFPEFYIQYNPCDTLSKEGYRWQSPNSEEEHSFGLGQGWLIYSSTKKQGNRG